MNGVVGLLAVDKVDKDGVVRSVSPRGKIAVAKRLGGVG